MIHIEHVQVAAREKGGCNNLGTEGKAMVAQRESRCNSIQKKFNCLNCVDY